VPAAQQPGRAKQQRASTHREDLSRARRLRTQPVEHDRVVHQCLLPRAARHVQDIERRRVVQSGVRDQALPLHVAYGLGRARVKPVRGARQPR
jgi:hypothetical protein